MNNILKDEISFEIRSIIGRCVFGRALPQKSSKARYLNFGSGNVEMKGWVCADFYNGIIPWNRKKVKKLWMFDFRQGIPCQDNYWLGIFSEHVIEHFTYKQVEYIFSELYRTLKPGRPIRISVPCIEKCCKTSVSDIEYAKSLHNLTQEYGHKSVCNYELLKKYLKQSNFKSIRQYEYKKGTKKMLIDNPDRSFESLYVEAKK